MGGCCDSCMKSSEEIASKRDYVPLVTSDAHSEQQQPEISENKSRYYQSIIDDAQGKFLNASYRRNNLGASDVGFEIMKGKLTKATVDKSLIVSPPNRVELADITLIRHRVPEILGEPVIVSPQVDMATDEIAELISNYAFHVARVDDGASALVSLKPVAGTIS